MSERSRRARRARRALALASCAALLLGVLIDRAGRPAAVSAPPAVPAAAPVQDVEAADEAGADTHRAVFAHGVTLLRAGEPRRAAAVFHALLARTPALPEAHVNLGFALLADGRPAAARARFERAIDLRPGQVNAYWGLAVALETVGDLRGALGAMRSYVHLTRADDPFLARARSALWEWQAALEGRAATGTTAPPDTSR